MDNATDSTRETHQHRMETMMKEWGARLDALKERADKASADAKEEMHQQVTELGQLQDAAKKHFEEFKVSTKDAWKDVKADVEAQWASLTTSVENLMKNARS